MPVCALVCRNRTLLRYVEAIAQDWDSPAPATVLGRIADAERTAPLLLLRCAKLVSKQILDSQIAHSPLADTDSLSLPQTLCF